MEEAQIKQIIERQPLHGSALLDPRCKILLLVCIGFVSYFLAGEVVSLVLMLVYGLFIALGNGGKWAVKMIVTYIILAYLNALPADILPAQQGRWVGGHICRCTVGLFLHARRTSPAWLPVFSENVLLGPNLLSLPCAVLVAFPSPSPLFLSLYHISGAKGTLSTAPLCPEVSAPRLGWALW